MCYTYKSAGILFGPWGVYSSAETQNLAHHINIKCEEKIPNNKQRAIRKIGLLQTNWLCLVFFYINAVQTSPVYSQGNDFVISVKYIENEISGSTKCAQT